MRTTKTLALILTLLVSGVSNADTIILNLDFDTFDQRSTLVGVLGVDTITFNITNSTDQIWTDFHVDSIVGLDVSSYVGPGDAVFGASSTLPEILGGQTISGSLDIFGLNIGIGSLLTFSTDAVCPAISESCQAMSQFGQQINLYPTAEEICVGDECIVPVPEPSTLALFALGLLGLGFARRRA